MSFMKVLKSKGTYTLGAAVGLITYILGLIVARLGIVSILNIGGQQVTAGTLAASLPIGTTITGFGVASPIGTKIMAYLTANIGFDIWELLVVMAGTTVIVIVGKTIFAWKWVPKGPARLKLAVQLFYGALIATVILAGWPFRVGFSAVVTMAIYYLVVATLVNLATRIKVFAKLVRE